MPAVGVEWLSFMFAGGGLGGTFLGVDRTLMTSHIRGLTSGYDVPAGFD